MFVEFFGPGLANLPLADRATIGNMAPEYGATCGIFPVDQVALDYLTFTGRSPEAGGDRRGLHEGAGALPHRRLPRGRRTPTSSSSTSARSSRASPAPAGRRTGCASRTSSPRSSRSCETMTAAGRTGKARPVAVRPAVRGRHGRGPGDRRARGRRRGGRRGGRAPARLGGDRRHHQLHQHLEPLGDDRRRPAGQEGGREGARQPSPG